jgi:hypothetical protein
MALMTPLRRSAVNGKQNEPHAWHFRECVTVQSRQAVSASCPSGLPIVTGLSDSKRRTPAGQPSFGDRQQLGSGRWARSRRVSA